MGRYLRTNYRLTGSYLPTEPPKPKSVGAIYYDPSTNRIYIYMSGASWVYYSAAGIASLNV